jgi:hypothetical protein
MTKVRDIIAKLLRREEQPSSAQATAPFRGLGFWADPGPTDDKSPE